MDSAKKNASKRIAFVQKLEMIDKSIVHNTYHQEIQKTFLKKSIEKEQIGILIEQVKEQDELSIQQRRVNQLVNLNRQLDDQIQKNDLLQQQKIMEDMNSILSSQLDHFINQQADRNQILNRLQSDFNANHQSMQILEGEYLITEFKKINQMDQSIYQQQSKEYSDLFEIQYQMQEELKIINGELEKFQKLNQTNNIQNYVLQGCGNKKTQYYCQKKKIRTFCIFYNKTNEYDQTYQPYFKIKNQKQISFENNELLNNENTSINLWSSSKQKVKKLNPYRCQFYKFDQIFQRKENSRLSQYEQLFNQLELFIKGTLYKQIDLILKSYAFNSQEYHLIYNQDLNENVEKIRKLCDKEKADTSNKLIVLLCDKNRGLIVQLVSDVVKILSHFNNQLIEVNSLILTLTKFQIKDQQSEDILECNAQNIEMMLDCLRSKEIFRTSQFHLKIEINLTNNVKRILHILMLAPLLIENNELFCKQFKNIFKREKAFKEQIGTRIESIVKNIDKIIIITQIPEMIQTKENSAKKISIIQNIINFSSLLVVKQEN
ncbi:unnamed protein product (macronuclear) [Paramecium tetraurelia]|uniref:Uncharacterized protein n=1 Tax=Paramecium tetraurelia TaxID=5888 RepID=A0DVY1_PARTE|nr:uncharacterized protein GSPATT00020851001 [Paramecium tetraurelia]CAK87198.1 unnamed protein product [Paramecium tetraurelia]|eukprot:XP_001454595.1 hypothetical protein (macronuclear) [Paramecium tetraurelia strain d4-2]